MMESIAFAGMFLFLGAVLIRLFLKTSNKNRAIIVLSSFALSTAATTGLTGVLLIAATAVAAYAAYDYAKNFADRRRAKEEAKLRRAGAIFGEEFFRKEEEARMRRKMRDIHVPKRIGEDDSPEIKEARASLIRRIK